MSGVVIADLCSGWEVASSAPGVWERPQDITGANWVEAQVPGTAAAAVGFSMRQYRNFDDEDWFFRARFAGVAGHDAGAQGLNGIGSDSPLWLEFDGIATVSQVFLNGELILESTSMWATHKVEVTGRLLPDNELVIACRALSPLLAVSRRPRQRWRTRWVYDGNLRWYRTSIFGRSPGHAPGPAPVGPWRPVRLVGKTRSRDRGAAHRAAPRG